MSIIRFTDNPFGMQSKPKKIEHPCSFLKNKRNFATVIEIIDELKIYEANKTFVLGVVF